MHGTQKSTFPSIPSLAVPGSTCLPWFAIALDATAIKSTECKRSQTFSQFDGQRVHVDAIRKMLIENHNSVMQKVVLRISFHSTYSAVGMTETHSVERVTHVRPSKFGARQCSIWRAQIQWPPLSLSHFLSLFRMESIRSLYR